ncbi:helix-turn-helix transcriptional regulator [Novosphingobium sp. Leaf2]|uniref:helix-turn-helix transcriptional regulator n=1 Tax=Novosphingobium sp. Leaf2 TaxID=1735670 RepID=UPI0006F64522|nr:hypothetical protein [Novosphingobium sp. Leaf2]KQM13361.1 chemotaxis protein CheY [Novosphingobium sp. Leaf2]
MRPDDSTLLTALHQGVFDQPLWAGFLDNLRARTGAHHAALLLRPIGENTLVQLFSGNLLPPPVQRLLRDAADADRAPGRQMREDRVYALQEMLDQPRALEAQLEGRIMRIAERGGLDAWLCCIGGRETSWAVVSALLTDLASHVRVALRTFVALERQRFDPALSSEAYRPLDYGWATLDGRCRIVDSSAGMGRLFQRSHALRRGRYDRLTPASPAADRELTALVRRFAEDPEARPRAITLSRDPLIDMLVRPIRNRSPSTSASPIAIVYVKADRWSHADRCTQLVDLFGLLPSEARLAWAIAQGQSIAQAAADLGLTIETARNYSKKIYAKTGSRGQADLVRHILTSMLALA